MFISAMVDVAGHAGKLDTAFEVLKEARNKGISTGTISYSSLMGACCNVCTVLLSYSNVLKHCVFFLSIIFST